MITVLMLLLVVLAVMVAIGARKANLEKTFRLFSILPPVLFMGSFLALRSDGNSLPAFAIFCLSLVLGLVGLAFGVTLTILHRKRGVPVGRLALISLWAGFPVLYLFVRKLILQ